MRFRMFASRDIFFRFGPRVFGGGTGGSVDSSHIALQIESPTRDMASLVAASVAVACLDMPRLVEL